MNKPNNQKPKGDRVALKEADIERFVNTQDDFGLELFVYSTAMNLGLSVTHGGTYKDSVTGLARQYDIRASIIINEKACIELPIECKCLKDTAPIIISRIPRSQNESYHEKIVHNHLQDGYVGGRNINLNNISGVNSLYPPNEYVGKSINQITLNDRGEFGSVQSNDIYGKWSQALASAHDLVLSPIDGNRAQEKYNSKFTLVVPIVVVSDNTLWVADYSENGILQGSPRLVDEATLFVGQQYVIPNRFSYKISHLHFLTKSGLLNYLTNLANDGFTRTRFSF